MILEILIGTAGSFIVDRIIRSAGKDDHDRVPAFWYALTESWWKGAFIPETPSMTIANMIDSDRSCEIWEYDNSVDCSRKLFSKSLGVSVYPTNYGLCRLLIDRKDKRDLDVSVSSHDDYILRRSISRFLKRKDQLQKMREYRESTDLINDRITKKYIETIEMVEKRILHREPEEANELRALLTSPPKETIEYIDHGIGGLETKMVTAIAGNDS